jgi:hypothetical protein
MEVSDAHKLKALEDENRRLKKLLAESMLDAATLKEKLGKTSDAQLAETSCDLRSERRASVWASQLSLIHDPDLSPDRRRPVFGRGFSFLGLGARF